jgi:catechol 2,3-dioxygenase-like lactoylglutathione lyase family enzyme
MLAEAGLIAFVPTTDLDRAKKFYAGTLGLTLRSVNQFACVFDANGTMLRVTAVSAVTPQPFTVLGWAVPDIYAAARDLAGAGIQLERFDGLDQDETGVWTAPDGDLVAWFHDPDGNRLSIAQFG